MLTVQTRQSRLAKAAIAGVSLLAIMAGHPERAVAQTAKQSSLSGGTEEIIVTARRREESIMKAPVVIQAIGQKQIESMHVTGTTAISNITPNLAIATGYALAGIVVNMRGLGNGGSANFVDQSVALNIDGFTSNSGTVYRLGLFDTGQIEVLKGPQSLFYGKSTSAGLIAIHSADPTKTWDTKVNVGYEFNADEMDVNGYVSGPLTDNLGIRIAGYHNTVKGWLINSNTTNPFRRVPDSTENGGRLTLKYDNPDTGLRVKLKAAYTKSTTNSWSSTQNENICPGGVTTVPLLAQYSPCHLGEGVGGSSLGLPYNPNVVFNNLTNPGAWATNEPSRIFGTGVPYGLSEGALSVLSIDYDIARGVTVSSVTALDYVKAMDVGRNPTAGVQIADLGGESKTQEFSQELRLTTNWKDRWYNFMIGGLYNPTTRRDHLAANYPVLLFYTEDKTRLKGETDSAFGQVLLTPVDKFELSAGVRYTHVRKHFVSLRAVALGAGVSAAQSANSGLEQLQNVPLAQRDASENATTPEVTLTYRPTDDLTAFITYKKGYKGIAYNADLATKGYTAATNISPVGGEHVKGAEGGIKAQLLDRQLALTATGYMYDYNGIQVAFNQIQTSTIVIANGANARVQGFEVGGDYSPRAVEGLTLNAFVNYSDSHYTRFNQAPCWGNQTVAAGCATPPGTVALPGFTVGKSENLAGKPLSYAPKWSGTFGATYKMDVNDKYMMAFDFHTKMQSSYYATPELNPVGFQKSYALLDFGVRGGPQDESWELSLLCRNCTNHYYLVSASDGGPSSAPAASGLAIVTGIVARPREILLNLTVHPFRGD